MTILKENESEKVSRPVAKRAPKQFYRLNIWVLLATLALLTVSWFGGRALHKVQLKRLSAAFLDRATSLENDSEWKKASQSVGRYLRLQPDDGRQRARMARDYMRFARTASAEDSAAAKRRAVELLYRAIGADIPDEEISLREDLCGLLLETAQYADAEREAGHLPKDNPVGLRVAAISLWRQHESGLLERDAARDLDNSIQIINSLDQARRANPADLELTMLLAAAYRTPEIVFREFKGVQLDPPGTVRADNCVDEIVSRRSEDAEAYLSRFSYRKRYDLPGADTDLTRALELGPDNGRVLMAAAEAAKGQADKLNEKDAENDAQPHLETALGYLQHIVQDELLPDEIGPDLLLGDVLLALKRPKDAETAWLAGVVRFPNRQITFQQRLADHWLVADGVDSRLTESLDAIDSYIGKLPKGVEANYRLTLQRDQALRRGTWRVKRGEVALAMTDLRSVISMQERLGGNSMVATRAWILLGHLLSSIEDWGGSALAFDRASTQLPSAAALRLSAATAWLSARRFDIAIERAVQAENLQPSAKSAFTWATGLLQQQLSLPPQERNWSAFDRAITLVSQRIADRTLEDTWRLHIIKADGLLARKSTENVAAARMELRAAEAAFPDHIGLWRVLPFAYERMQSTQDSDRALDHLETLLGDPIQLASIKVELQLARNELPEAEAEIMKALGAAKAEESGALRKQLARVKMLNKDLPAAREILEKIQQSQPSDLWTLRQLADIDLLNGKLNFVERWETAMRSAGGAGDVFAKYFQIRRKIHATNSISDLELANAAKECDDLIAQRPGWPEALSLRGLIHERLRNTTQAILDFEQAIAAGEQRIAIFEHLLMLLENSNRAEEGQKYLARLKDYVPFSQKLTAFESNLELKSDQIPSAVEVARRGVEKRPNSPESYIWLGRMLMANNQPTEAGGAFEKAVEIKADNVAAWNALVAYYVQTQSPERARESLSEMAKKVPFGPVDRAFTLAQGYALIGDRELAESNFKEALKLSPENTVIWTKLGDFYAEFDIAEARKCMEAVLAIDPKSGAARRRLAQFLARSDNEADWSKIHELLAASGPSDSASIDNRLHAILLGYRGGVENLLKSAQLFEGLLSQQVSADHIALATIYERLSRITSDASGTHQRLPHTPEHYLEQCRANYLAVCAKSSSQPTQIIAFVEFLIRQRDTTEARNWVNQLETIVNNLPQESQPESLRSVIRLRMKLGDFAAADKLLQRYDRLQTDPVGTLELKAAVQEKLKGREAANAVVLATVEQLQADQSDAKSRARLFAAAGRAFERLGMLDNAEQWFVRTREQVPGAYDGLARVLAKQGNFANAIEVCNQSMVSGNDGLLKAAMIAASILLEPKATLADVDAAEPIFRKSMETFPDNVQLLNSIATLRTVKGQSAEAIKLFRKVLRLNPRFVVAMNNLAFLLADQPNMRDEAMALIDQAIELAGGEATFYDTKGTILLFDNKFAEAVEFFQAALAAGNEDPRFRLHLAFAFLGLNSHVAARSQLELADSSQLSQQILTEKEQQMLSQLRKALGAG